MALGMGRLRLTPDTFWSLTPRELMLIAGGGRQANPALRRSELTELMQRFPDQTG